MNTKVNLVIHHVDMWSERFLRSTTVTVSKLNSSSAEHLLFKLNETVQKVLLYMLKKDKIMLTERQRTT